MAKRTGRLLDRDVVHDLVVGALQEGRIDRANGFMPSVARPAAKVTACCSAMPTSKVRSGKARRTVEAGARRHRGGDGDDLRSTSASPIRLSPNTLV
jgi:hypothetical protein